MEIDLSPEIFFFGGERDRRQQKIGIQGGYWSLCSLPKVDSQIFDFLWSLPRCPDQSFSGKGFWLNNIIAEGKTSAGFDKILMKTIFKNTQYMIPVRRTSDMNKNTGSSRDKTKNHLEPFGRVQLQSFLLKSLFCCSFLFPFTKHTHTHTHKHICRRFLTVASWDLWMGLSMYSLNCLRKFLIFEYSCIHHSRYKEVSHKSLFFKDKGCPISRASYSILRSYLFSSRFVERWW